MSTRRAFAEHQFQQRTARRRRRWRAVVLVSAMTASVLALAAVAIDRLFQPGAFPIQELRLEGEFVHLAPETLREIIVNELGDNFFSLDLDRIERAVEKLPWVYRATVRRSWPHGLVVQVSEQRPVARWGRKDWLNADARVIHLEHATETKNLVGLDGPAGSAQEVWQRYQAWLPAIKDLGLEVVSMKLDTRYAWVMDLAEVATGARFLVLLGRDHTDQRWQRFVKSYPTFLRNEAPRLLSVDLRYPNGLATRHRDEPQPEQSLQG